MIVDALEVPDGSTLDADVCIIGAGAAGITVALELAGSGLDILVVESGGLRHEPATQALYAGTVADDALHSPLDHYRERRFGGSTTIWGGRCMPLDSLDFEARPWIPYSGWPIGPADLAPHYPQANALCEAGEFAYTARAAFERPLRPMVEGFAPADFSLDTLERFSCPTDFAARYGGRLARSRDVRVLLHANTVGFAVPESGTRVEDVSLAALDGRRLRVVARRVVVAAGGLETVRLLLAGSARHPDGIGNAHGALGRYYMCHLAGTIGEWQVPGAAWHGYDVADDGTYCRRRIALRPEAQRREGVGAFVARLHHPRIGDPRHGSAVLSALYLGRFLVPFEYRKRLHSPERLPAGAGLRHVANLVTGPLEAARFALHLVRDRALAARKFPSLIVAPRGNLFSLDFHAEQEPNPASRAWLGEERDALGMRRLVVDWRYTPGDVRTVGRSLALLAAEVRRAGRGELRYDPAKVEGELTRYGAYGGHHIGMARMGSDPHTSVVDADCRVHGMENLWIAGAAVFPTSSQANPTLTIVALALRLAGRLRDAARAERPADLRVAPATGAS